MVAVNLWGQLPSNDEILQASVRRAHVETVSAPVQRSGTQPAVQPSSWSLLGGVILLLMVVGWALHALAQNGAIHAVTEFLTRETLPTIELPSPSAPTKLREIDNRATAAPGPVEQATPLANTTTVAPDRAFAAAAPIRPSPSQMAPRTPPAPARTMAVSAEQAALQMAQPLVRATTPVRDRLPPPSGISADMSQASVPASDLKFKRIDPMSVNSEEAAAISPLTPN